MPSEETIELRKIKSVVGEPTDSPELNPRASIASRIRTLLLKLSGMPRQIHIYGTYEPNKQITLDSGENNILTSVSNGTNMYAGCYTSPGKVVKIDLSTFTKHSTLQLDTGENSVRSSCIIGSDLYLGLATTPGKVIKVDLNSFTKTNTLTLDPGEDNILSLSSDGSYLYCGLDTSPGKVVKVDLNTFAKDSTLTLAAGENSIRSSSIDESYLFVGLVTTPGKVVKIDLSTFTKDSTLTLDTGENNIYSIIQHVNHLYCGLDITPGKVVKVNINSFTRVGSVSTTSGGRAMTSDGGYLFYIGVTGVGVSQIHKIDLATFAFISTIVPNTSSVRTLVPDETYLYSGTETSPGTIKRNYIVPSSSLSEKQTDLICTKIKTYKESKTDTQLTVPNGVGEVTLKTFDKATYGAGHIKAFKIDLDKAVSGFQTLAAVGSTIKIRVYEKIDGTNYRLRTDDGQSYTWTQGVVGDKVAELDDISFSEDCQIRAVLSVAPTGTINLPWLCELNQDMEA